MHCPVAFYGFTILAHFFRYNHQIRHSHCTRTMILLPVYFFTGILQETGRHITGTVLAWTLSYLCLGYHIVVPASTDKKTDRLAHASFSEQPACHSRSTNNNIQPVTPKTRLTSFSNKSTNVADIDAIKVAPDFRPLITCATTMNRDIHDTANQNSSLNRLHTTILPIRRKNFLI